MPKYKPDASSTSGKSHVKRNSWVENLGILIL